jgi:putative hydrolase of HD superfamily
MQKVFLPMKIDKIQLEKFHQFLEILGKLKFVKRLGWISNLKMKSPESVADHSFRCAFLAMCIGDLIGANSEKLIRMLLLHDIQEAITGDYDLFLKKQIGIDKVKNHEKITIQKILSLLPPKLNEEYLSLWIEFQNKATFEASLAHDIDKIELILQAIEYEKEGYDPDKFQTFWSGVSGKINTNIVLNIFELLKNKRT